MAKVNFLTRAVLFMSESYISQLHGNANRKTKTWKYILYLGRNEKKKSRKERNKIEARLAKKN